MTCDRSLASALVLVVLLFFMWPNSIEGKRRHRQDCMECDQRRCPSVYLHNCNSKIVLDRCGCCPICSSGMVPLTTTHIPKDDKCSKITCTKGKICMLNIQDIPICRCPSTFMCSKRKEKPVCGKDGVTYRSRCHLRITGCTKMKKVRVAYKGPCKDDNGRRKINRQSKKEKTIIPHATPRERGKDYKETDFIPVDKKPDTHRPNFRETDRQRNRGANKLRPRDRNRKRKSKERMIANQRNRDRESALQRHRQRRYRTRRNKALSSLTSI